MMEVDQISDKENEGGTGINLAADLGNDFGLNEGG
jgi:hypothetical protein